MSEPRPAIRIQRAEPWDSKAIYYAVITGTRHGFLRVQDAFDYCARLYPGEPVIVDIRP